MENPMKNMNIKDEVKHTPGNIENTDSTTTKCRCDVGRNSKLDEIIEHLHFGITYSYGFTVSLSSEGFDELTLRSYYSNRLVPEDVFSLIIDKMREKSNWMELEKKNKFISRSKSYKRIYEYINRLRFGVQFPHKQQPYVKPSLVITLNSKGFDEKTLKLKFLERDPETIGYLIKLVLWPQNQWELFDSKYDMDPPESKLDEHIKQLKVGMQYPHKTQSPTNNNLSISLKSAGFEEISLRTYYLNNPVPNDFYTLVKQTLVRQKLWDYVNETYDMSGRCASTLDDHIEKLRAGIKYLHKNTLEHLTISLESSGFEEPILRLHYLNNPVPNDVHELIEEILEMQK